MTREEYKKIRHVVDKVMEELEEFGPYIYHEATTGSTYMKFNTDSLRSLRISNHEGRKKYKYKWNLYINDDHFDRRISDGGVIRYFYHIDDLDEMLKHMYNYARKVVKKEGEADAFAQFRDEVLKTYEEEEDAYLH